MQKKYSVVAAVSPEGNGCTKTMKRAYAQENSPEPSKNKCNKKCAVKAIVIAGGAFLTATAAFLGLAKNKCTDNAAKTPIILQCDDTNATLSYNETNASLSYNETKGPYGNITILNNLPLDLGAIMELCSPDANYSPHLKPCLDDKSKNFIHTTKNGNVLFLTCHNFMEVSKTLACKCKNMLAYSREALSSLISTPVNSRKLTFNKFSKPTTTTTKPQAENSPQEDRKKRDAQSMDQNNAQDYKVSTELVLTDIIFHCSKDCHIQGA